jgi:hypothetical protein
MGAESGGKEARAQLRSALMAETVAHAEGKFAERQILIHEFLG